MNVYDARTEDNLYFILPTDYSLTDGYDTSRRVLIIVHLFYLDSLDFYCNYISKLDHRIRIIVISPIREVLQNISESIGRDDIVYILKENRGRDISALLISSKEHIDNADYVCFVHDKKEHQNLQRDSETGFWVSGMWENTIGTQQYIENLIDVFESDPELGVLTIPEPIGSYFDTWAGQGWYGSFDATKDLAQKLDLNCDITPDKPPVSIGTVLWFRPAALKKLFDHEWKYSDFDDDKLRDGNYLSYAVERIFPYVAQDAGYKTGTVMTCEYAKKQTAIAQRISYIYSKTIKELIGVSVPSECEEILNRYDKLLEACRDRNDIYLYGAGYWGKVVLHLLRLRGIGPAAFIETEKNDRDRMEDVDIVSLEELGVPKRGSLVIVTVSGHERYDQISKRLEQAGCEYFWFWE